ncbi:MAG: DUF58 domain-containing protein [Rhizobiales bacterium PAR1]|nr:MAG: DUF58 domain-containing protein [Rhizobiales bacterium PAR1]
MASNNMAIEEARAIPAFTKGPPLALTSEAARLADVLPHLVVEARNVAAQLQLGIHGRRRPGPGEEFWEFRPFVAGESTSRIDWRRSARDDRLYVREREWESASVHWLWIDFSASMHFASRLAERPKRDRAVLIGLALADLLVHAGERVGMPGETPPLASRNIIMRLAETMARRKPGTFDPMTADALPDTLPIRRQDHLVMIGDFIMPTEEFAEKLARIAHRGVRGTVVLIRDPAEEEFPFSGELEFEGLESNETWRVGEAQEIAVKYRERISAINEELRRIALKNGFGFVKHLTHRPAAETLLTLAALIGGNAA